MGISTSWQTYCLKPKLTSTELVEHAWSNHFKVSFRVWWFRDHVRVYGVLQVVLNRWYQGWPIYCWCFHMFLRLPISSGVVASIYVPQCSYMFLGLRMNTAYEYRPFPRDLFAKRPSTCIQRAFLPTDVCVYIQENIDKHVHTPCLNTLKAWLLQMLKRRPPTIWLLLVAWSFYH